MRIRTQSGIVLKLKRHGQATNYTEERVQLVMERIKGGEFLRDIAFDLGMDPRSLARYCRRKGVSMFSADDLKKNYGRRVGIGRPRKHPKTDVPKAVPQVGAKRRGRPPGSKKGGSGSPAD